MVVSCGVALNDDKTGGSKIDWALRSWLARMRQHCMMAEKSCCHVLVVTFRLLLPSK